MQRTIRSTQSLKENKMKLKVGLVWAVGAVIPLVSFAQSTASISFGTAEQTIEGFGGSTAFLGQIPSGAVNALYGNSSLSQIGLSLLRVSIDPGGQPNWGPELANAKAAQALGATVFATPWSPPASMKSNNSTVGGTLNTSEYGAYASYLNSFVSYMASNGVSLYAISMQNEPDANVTYASCSWTGTTMDNWVREEGGTISARLIMPESESFHTSYSDPTLNDSSAVGHVSIVAGHLYGASPSFYTNAFNHGKQVWMTEHYISSVNISGAMQEAQEIAASMAVANYSAYVWWHPYDGSGPYGFINSSSDAPTLFGYVMEQWSKFVRPGYKRYSSTYNPNNNIFTNAFAGSGHFVIVAVNTGTSSFSQPFSISGATISSLQVYQTSNANQTMKQLSNVSVSSDKFTYTLPAQSVTTFYE
jgi:glucuronoarabinoxylan endo-1,4-beta-xylanase